MERVALSLVKGGLYSKVAVAMVMACNNSSVGRRHVRESETTSEGPGELS